jgi:hypothetical protein
VDENIIGSDGAFVTIDELQEGVWYNSSILNHYDSHYLKFNVPYDSSRPCPILTIEFQQEVGTLSAFISARQIPNNAFYDFTHAFYAYSMLAICPSQPQFYYGMWYVYINNQAGRSTNIYGMRFTLTQSPTCKAPPTVNVDALPSSVGSRWIDDGVLVPVVSAGVGWAYYNLYSEGRCANFSAAVYRTVFTDGTPSIFVSANNNMKPNDQNLATVDWYAFRLVDVFVNIQYCNPDPSATYNIFYIGIKLQGSLGNHQFVATTNQYQASMPLTSLAYYQSRLELAYSASPSLVCEDAVFSCTFFSFKGCENAGIGCCKYFGPATPEEHAQAIWPWNSGDNSVAGFHLGINWVDMQPLVAGKLAWSLLLEWSDATTRNVITTVDPGKCNITLGGGFHNARYEPLQLKSLSFEPKPMTCDYSEYERITNKMEATVATYVEMKENVNDLALQQVRVVIDSWQDAYIACKELVTESYISLAPEYTQDNVYICTKFPNSAAWLADPCCNKLLLSTTSCRPTAVSRLLPISGSVNRAATSGRCANPECAATSVQTFLETTHNADDEATGCQDSLSRLASVEKSTDLLVFTTQCQALIESADMLGARCTSSADCYNGAACDSFTGRCQHVPDDVLDCMANRINFDTALGLFSMWGLTGKPDPASLLDAFRDHWLRPLCTGPHSLAYRTGFHYQRTLLGCVDYCLLENMEPYCVDSSKSRTAACMIPSFCDRAANVSVCYRYWSPTFEDEQGCLDSKICNWRANSSYPCPEGGLDDCEADCLAGSPNVCLDCSRDIAGTCLEIDWINSQSRCDQGLCTTDDSITDPAACALAGTCSAKCVGCDQSQCVATGTCSDYNDFKTLADLGNTGVCLKNRDWNGVSYTCSAGWTLKGWACAKMDASITDTTCPSQATGAFWYEFASSPTECTTNAGYGCYSTTSKMWWMRNQTECAICPDCVWKPRYTWSGGVWTPGRIQSLRWDTRRYYTPTSYSPAVDYSRATRDVNAAITRDFAYAYYTDSLCRYDSVNGLVKSIVCDCNTDDKSQCFEKRDQAAIGSTQVCPYQTRTMGTSVAIVHISNTVVSPSQGCQTVEIAATSVGKYQVPPDHSVTHALFSKIEKNPYLIVVNEHEAVVGQLVSDAATMTFDFEPATPIRLCVFVQDFIAIDKAATIYTFAQVQDDSSIQVLAGASEYTRVDLQTSNSTRLEVCTDISQSGTYFAVAVVPNYKKLDPSPNAETIASVCIYVALLCFAVVQAILLVLDRDRQKLLPFKLCALFVVAVNCVVRIIYMVPPKDAFKKGSESIAFIVFELPTFLYFSVFTVIMYLWILVVINTRHFGKRSAMNEKKPVLRLLFIMMNVFMYFVFVVFIFLVAILPQATKKSPCFLGNLDSAVTSIERTIKIAYWIFQLVVSVLLAIGFLVAAIGLLRIVASLNSRDLGRQERYSKRKARRAAAADVQMIIITVVAFVCVIFLLVRSSIFLNVAVNSSTLHVIVFCILEVVPQAMLVFYLHPFRCFRETGRKSTSGSSSKGNSSTASKTPSYTRGSKAETPSNDDTNAEADAAEMDDVESSGGSNDSDSDTPTARTLVKNGKPAPSGTSSSDSP